MPIGGNGPAKGETELWNQSLTDRVRLMVWILLATTISIAVGEVILRPGKNPLVTSAHAFCVLVLCLLVLVLGSLRSRRAIVFCGFLAFAVAALTSSIVAGLTRDATTTSFLFVALSMGTAAFLPWGGPPQLLIGLTLTLLFPLTIIVAEDNFSIARARELVGLAAVLTASAYIASELERSRKLAWSEQVERRDREAELVRQRAFLRQVLDTNPHLIFAKDRGGRFTLVNQAMADLYETSIDALIGRGDADFIPNLEEIERFRRDDIEVMEKAIEKLIPEEIITDPRGNQKWLRTVKRPLVEPDGQINQVVGVATDITEYVRSQEQLRDQAYVAASLARMGESIIGSLNSPDLLRRLCQVTAETLECDWAQMWLTAANESVVNTVAHHGTPAEVWEAMRVMSLPREIAERLWQHAERDVTILDGRQSVDLLPEPLLRLNQGFNGMLDILLRRAGEISGSLTVGTRNRPLPCSPRSIRIAQGISQLASLALENARLVDQLERANRLKTEFMATMSHELRTPLNVIIGYSALLGEGEMGPVTQEQQYYLSRLKENAIQLLELINATLDVSRLESGQVPLDIRPVQLTTLLEQTARETQEFKKSAGVTLQWDIPRNLPLLHTDPIKLKVVLKNLVSNALKFTTSGNVHTSVSVEHGNISIRVADTGIGIEPDVQEAIFDAFRQANSSIGAQYGGVGLGLYIVRRLTETIGGEIRVESVPGRGSVFTIDLPVEQNLTIAMASPATPRPVGPADH